MNNLGCHLQVANLQREQPGISVSCRCFFRVFSVLQNVILTTLITAIAICGVRAPAASSEDFDRNRDNGMATIAAQDREANGEAVIQKSAAESDGPDKMDETDLSRAKQMIRKLRNKGFDESRYAEALDLLKAWGTGHPGGIGTIHAGTALGALRRMEQLIQEAVVTVPRALLAETINLIAVLVRDGHGRRLAELARVDGLDPATDDYRLTSLSQPSSGDLP